MTNTFKILLIDEESTNTALVNSALRESQFYQARIFTAMTVEEAIKLRGERFDLLLVDITGSDFNLEVLDTIFRFYPDVCLIVLIEPDDEGRALEAVSQGAQNYLIKGELNGKVLNRVIPISLERHRLFQKLKVTERDLLLSKQSLEISEARLLESQAVAKVGSWEVDLKTRAAIWSHETFHIFDLDVNAADHSYDSFLHYVHPEDRVRVNTAFLNSLHDSTVNQLEHRIVTTRGVEKWVFEWWKVHHDGSGTPVKAAGTCQDITERKNAEAKIRLNELRLSKAQLIGKLGYWQIDLESDTFLASKEAMRLFGLPPEERELSRASLYDYVIDNERLNIAYDELINFGKEFNTEFRIRQPDGSVRSVHAVAELERNESGTVARIVGSLQDITDRKLAEEQIHAEKYFSESLINSLPGVFYLYDRNGRFNRWNKNFELISEYTADQIAVMRPLDFFDEDEKDSVRIKIENVFQGNDEEITAHFFTREKKKIPYYFNGHKISIKGIDYLIGVGIDITARSRAEQELMAYNHEIKKLTRYLEAVREEERTRISREIHDELGQHLTVLKMDASWLKNKLDPESQLMGEKLEDMIGLMDHTVQTIRRIASDLRPGILDDLGLIAALEWQSHEFEKRTEIKCVFSSELDDVNLDKNLSTGVFRIYQETLTNVIRHSSADRVEAIISTSTGGLHFKVTDNGIGFDQNEKKGTLGLVGMRERALMIGGNLNIVSSLGQGTSVILTIPQNGFEQIPL